VVLDLVEFCMAVKLEISLMVIDFVKTIISCRLRVRDHSFLVYYGLDEDVKT
jgi:hypothetical protein